jgi:hypothetical protein
MLPMRQLHVNICFGGAFINLTTEQERIVQHELKCGRFKRSLVTNPTSSRHGSVMPQDEPFVTSAQVNPCPGAYKSGV